MAESSITLAMRDLATHRDKTNGTTSDFCFLLVSQEGGAIGSALGIPVWTDVVEHRHLDEVHAVFVIGGAEHTHRYDERMLAWLRRAHRHADLMAHACGCPSSKSSAFS